MCPCGVDRAAANVAAPVSRGGMLPLLLVTSSRVRQVAGDTDGAATHADPGASLGEAPFGGDVAAAHTVAAAAATDLEAQSSGDSFFGAPAKKTWSSRGSGNSGLRFVGSPVAPRSVSAGSPSGFGGGGSGTSEKQSQGLKDAAREKPALRHSVTGISVVSHQSIRARDLPKFMRSVSSGSLASPATQGSTKSTIVLGGVKVELEIPGLREHHAVPVMDSTIGEVYETEKQLGEGGFGQVYQVRAKQTGERFAAKQVRNSNVEHAEMFKREMQIFARFQSRYLVQLQEVYREQDCVYLIMDLCEGGDLMEYLQFYWSDPAHPERGDLYHKHRIKGLPWQEVVRFLWQLLSAIAYLHHHSFVHRDVKLENCMLGRWDGARTPLKLADFGLAARTKKGSKFSVPVGTLIYMAPEVISGSYNEKCDIWSAGVFSRILCLKAHPWGQAGTEDVNEFAQNIVADLREEWPESDKPPQLKNLTDRLMTYCPKARPHAKTELSSCAWFRQHGQPGGGQSCCGIQ